MAYRDELTDAAAAILRQHPGRMTVEEAYRLALQDDPTLYSHDTPDGSEGSGGRQEPVPAPSAPPGHAGPGGRHFSALSTAERRLELVRLGYGEGVDPERSYVAKMADSRNGGGIFRIVGS